MAALRSACKELGFEFLENKQTYAWYGQWVNDYHGSDAAYKLGVKTEDYGKCVHAIRIPGSHYEIGVINHPSGKGYGIIWDFYGTGNQITRAVGGTTAPKLMQAYSAAKLKHLAQRKGWRYSRVNNNNGTVTIELKGM